MQTRIISLRCTCTELPSIERCMRKIISNEIKIENKKDWVSKEYKTSKILTGEACLPSAHELRRPIVAMPSMAPNPFWRALINRQTDRKNHAMDLGPRTKTPKRAKRRKKKCDMSKQEGPTTWRTTTAASQARSCLWSCTISNKTTTTNNKWKNKKPSNTNRRWPFGAPEPRASWRQSRRVQLELHTNAWQTVSTMLLTTSLPLICKSSV